jgi:hypothetical protein
MSEWLLFNTNSVICQLYHGENKLIFNEMMIKQQFAGRHISPLGHIIPIPRQPVFALSP